MKTKGFLKGLVWFCMAGFFVSCAAAPEKSRMIPVVDYSTFGSTDRTLKVAEIKGGETTGWTVPKIDNTSLKQALIRTLNDSRIFKAIFTGQQGDYELDAEIISQKLEPGIEAYAALFIHYTLVETKTNQVIWTESIFSQNDGFGANQGKDVLEGAARDNLTQLVRKMAEILPRQSEK